MEILYKLAEGIIKRKKAKEDLEKKTHLHHIEEWKLQKAFLVSFSQNLERRMRESFQVSISPEFEIGEEVLTNWYGSKDSWEGEMTMLQSHTPFKGPIKAIITDRCVDTSFLIKELEDMIERGSFESVKPPYNPELFDKIALKHFLRTKYPHTSWVYMIRIPAVDQKYWTYAIRESKFLKLDSKEAKISLELYEKETKKNSLKTELENLEKQITPDTKKLKASLELIKK